MKKILLQTFILTLIIANFSLSQWSNDPNNNLVVAVGWDPHIVSDSAGGCFITYNYGSFYPQKLAVERLDKYGYKPWAERKQILGELPEQWQAEIIEDGEGGVIISYQDNQVIGMTEFITRVRVQRVDSNGNFLWEQTGVRVTLAEVMHGAQKLVSDGDGGCVVLWQDSLANYSINRIDRNGQRVWSDTGIVIGNGQSSSIIRASDGNYYIQISTNIYRVSKNGEILNQHNTTLGQPVADPEGGVVLSGRVGTINNRRLVAQRKDSLGNNLWQEPYVEIADSLHINTLLNIQHSNDYYYYGWVGKKNGLNNRVQFQALRKDGSLLFSNGSELLSGDSAISKMGIIPSYFSRMIFCWNIPGIINSTYSQMYDTLGNKLWNENGVIVAHPNILYQSFTTDGDGGFIIGGIINEFTVVAQQVNRYGKLGEIITSTDPGNNYSIPSEAILYQNFPNPFNSSTVIKYSIPSESYITIELYNVIGELIKTIVDGYHNEGIYTVTLSSNDFPSGIYLYKMKTDTQFLTKKLIIIK